jgi:hypothetical protein
MAEFKRYCGDHPRSPAAVRRPKLMIRGSCCVALLGSTLQDGIAGIGGTAQAALRAFDSEYRNSRRARAALSKLTRNGKHYEPRPTPS